MRSSKNCKKGTMMLKPATINAERYKELIIDKVIPAIKARMPRPPGHTIFDLVEATMEAFDVYPQETLERVWQSLFALLGEVLGSKGDNSYKLPHLGKDNLGRTGKLPVN
ncbi:unnamed protein product, partial [Discosporangium mesarthrocarpum]